MTITPLNVCGVSPQNKFEIIKYLLSSSAHSRNETAEALSLSSVTVGKVASALLERKILISESLSGQRGRSTELLFAAPTMTTLLLTIKESGFYATLLSLDRTEKPLITRHRNDSLPLEDDIRVFLASVRLEIESIDGIIGIFVVYGTKSPAKLGIDVDMMLGSKPQAIIPIDEAIGLGFKKNAQSYTALYIDISDSIHYLLYVDGRSVSNNATGHRLDDNDEYNIALELSKGLASIFEAVVPQLISINSDTVTVDKRFIELVASKTAAMAHISRADMPEFLYDRDLSLIGNAILDSSINHLTKRLAGID